MGYVGERKEFDSGVVKYNISFKEDQLDEMKKYLTSAGNVNVDFIIKSDGTAFTSVFNPRANGGQNKLWIPLSPKPKAPLFPRGSGATLSQCHYQS